MKFSVRIGLKIYTVYIFDEDNPLVVLFSDNAIKIGPIVIDVDYVDIFADLY